LVRKIIKKTIEQTLFHFIILFFDGLVFIKFMAQPMFAARQSVLFLHFDLTTLMFALIGISDLIPLR
jgi:hypothetical protein